MTKKPPPPKQTKAELKQEALRLLSSVMEPIEAVEWLLEQFNGWDLETIIATLKLCETTEQLKKETGLG